MKFCFGIGAVAVVLVSSVAISAAAEVKVWSKQDLLASNQLVTFGKRFRDTALQPFNPRSNARKGFEEQAQKASCGDAYIAFEGERKEQNNWGVSGVYYVVDGNCVNFVEPSKENIIDVIKGMSPDSVPFGSAILHAQKNPDAKEIAVVLLQTLKDSKNLKVKRGSTEAIDGMVAGYADIMGKEGVSELTKLLKFHPNQDVKVAAGKRLIKLGEANTVEAAVQNEKNTKVKELLSKALME